MYKVLLKLSNKRQSGKKLAGKKSGLEGKIYKWPTHMVKYSTSLIIEKMQIKTKTPLCSLGWLLLKKRKKNVGKDVENLEPLYIAGENVKWFSYYVKKNFFYATSKS